MLCNTVWFRAITVICAMSVGAYTRAVLTAFSAAGKAIHMVPYLYNHSQE